MQLFIDSADPKEIKTALSWGIIDGVTTNPSLAAKVGKPYKEIVAQILDMVDGPVSLETIATDYENIIDEAYSLARLSKNVHVKIPCIKEGFMATKTLAQQGIKVNMTLCFSVSQALLAAKAGATFVSPFIGRLDDVKSHSGDDLIANIRRIYDNYNFPTKILDASIRDIEHVENSALLGADITTVPFKILEEMFDHPLTYKGLEKFLADWKKAKLRLPV